MQDPVFQQDPIIHPIPMAAPQLAGQSARLLPKQGTDILAHCRMGLKELHDDTQITNCPQATIKSSKHCSSHNQNHTLTVSFPSINTWKALLAALFITWMSHFILTHTACSWHSLPCIVACSVYCSTAILCHILSFIVPLNTQKIYVSSVFIFPALKWAKHLSIKRKVILEMGREKKAEFSLKYLEYTFSFFFRGLHDWHLWWKGNDCKQASKQMRFQADHFTLMYSLKLIFSKRHFVYVDKADFISCLI